MTDPAETPDLPTLGPKAIDAYARFAKDLGAFNYVLRHTKQTGSVHGDTLLAVNGLILMANRLFRRHPDIPRFIPVYPSQEMALVDLTILVARLTAAADRFEEVYAHLKPNGRPR